MDKCLTFFQVVDYVTEGVLLSLIIGIILGMNILAGILQYKKVRKGEPLAGPKYSDDDNHGC